MNAAPRTILFLCTGNSARSILAEALVNNLPASKDKFKSYSAGSFPIGRVNPFALELLAANGINTNTFRSKSWDEFTDANAPAMDFIFTVCDQAAGEQCPYWPGQPITAHWGVADPAAVSSDDEQKRQAFRDTFTILRRRIELFASLPFEKLDALELQQRIQEIGQQ